MQLDLDRNDLKKEHQESLNCSMTKYPHFKSEVQLAIRIVGKASFKDNGGTNYNVIYPPSQKG